uniref:Myosin motor domain-containing protein n=1 Tax=Globodera pallida TaxID=36090 RepID=A0A183CTD6_GLOPA
ELQTLKVTRYKRVAMRQLNPKMQPAIYPLMVKAMTT